MQRVLLNSHRQELHRVLVAGGVDPSVTKWTNDKKKWTSGACETLEAGYCHFLFKPDDDGTFSIHRNPGIDGGAPKGQVNQKWESVLVHFIQWVGFVKKELTQIDPWQQLSAYVPPDRTDGPTDNSPFTHDEAERITTSIEQLREHITQQLPDYREVAHQFDPQFERLKSQAKSGAGRIDWRNQFVGMLISLCISLALAPEQAAAIWKYWARLVSGLLLH